MRDSFIKRLAEMAERDPRVMLITGDLGFGVFDNYREQYPEQFLNVGIAEQNMIGVATGMALEGHVVYTYSIANFSFMRCLEQIRNDAAYHQANVNVVCIGGGFSYGALGISHHATEDLAIMRSLPGVTVVSPTDRWEAANATEALANTPGVGYLRLDKSFANDSNRTDEIFELGRLRTLRDGSDITLVGAGGIMQELVTSAEQLEKYGVRCRVLSAHTIKPFDTEGVLQAAKETGGIITVEEHTIHGGLGGVVAETLLDYGAIPQAFHRIGLREGFSSVVGSQGYLRSRYGMDVNTIVDQVLSTLRGNPCSHITETVQAA